MAGGLTIAVVAIIWLGMSHFFEKGNYYAVYFDESVQGLSVDSPVKYRGVAIGRVERIRVAADSRLIEVIMLIESGLKTEKDMVAQLKVVGITGSMFIELDRQPDGMVLPTAELKFPTQYPVLPSRPSEISELFRDIDAIVQKFQTLDIAGISERLKTTLDHVDQAVVSTDLAGVADGAKAALKNLDQSVVDLNLKGISSEFSKSLDSLNQDLDPARWNAIMTKVDTTILALDATIDNTNRLLENAAGVVDETNAGIVMINRHLFAVGQDLEKASDSINRLLEQLTDQPSQLLFGTPPPRRLPSEQPPTSAP